MNDGADAEESEKEDRDSKQGKAAHVGIGGIPTCGTEQRAHVDERAHALSVLFSVGVGIGYSCSFRLSIDASSERELWSLELGSTAAPRTHQTVRDKHAHSLIHSLKLAFRRESGRPKRAHEAEVGSIVSASQRFALGVCMVAELEVRELQVHRRGAPRCLGLKVKLEK